MKQKMLKRISPHTLVQLRKISDLAEKTKTRVYLVGGIVRDLIRGSQLRDIDIAVEMSGIDFAEKLAREFNGQVKKFPRFQTAKVFIAEKQVIDVAMARTEKYAYPGALPEVRPGTIKEDLRRRDFTVNALALSLNQNDFGDLIDLYGGVRDITEKKIRILHDLSFIDDPTRIFRAIRFEQRLDFFLDKHTEILLLESVKKGMINRLKRFRLAEELIRLLSEPHPQKVFSRMDSLFGLKFLHSRLEFDAETRKTCEAAEGVLDWFKENFPEKILVEWIVYLTVILDSRSWRECRLIFKNFGFEKKAEECVRLSKSEVKKISALLERKNPASPSRIYKILRQLPLEFIIFLMARFSRPKQQSVFRRFLTKDINTVLEINGHDLKQVCPASLRFRAALEKVLFAKIDAKISGRQQELDLAKKILSL